MEPLSATAIATLALTKVFETSIEKFTETAIAKMNKLRKMIWDKFRGNVKAERALTAAAGIIQFAQNKMNLEVPQKRGESPLNIIQQVEWCWQHWYTPPALLTKAPVGKGGVREGEGLVLVVLDDVTDLRSCREVLPTASRFRVLMTT